MLPCVRIYVTMLGFMDAVSMTSNWRCTNKRQDGFQPRRYCAYAVSTTFHSHLLYALVVYNTHCWRPTQFRSCSMLHFASNHTGSSLSRVTPAIYNITTIVCQLAMNMIHLPGRRTRSRFSWQLSSLFPCRGLLLDERANGWSSRHFRYRWTLRWKNRLIREWRRPWTAASRGTLLGQWKSSRTWWLLWLNGLRLRQDRLPFNSLFQMVAIANFNKSK